MNISYFHLLSKNYKNYELNIIFMVKELDFMIMLMNIKHNILIKNQYKIKILKSKILMFLINIMILKVLAIYI